jgi:hypothetical protein
MSYVLKPMNFEKLNKIFDDKAKKIIQFQLEKSIIAQPERIKGQKEYRLQITKEYLEQWCVQAINATPIGAGSYPVDILKDDWGADVKSMTCSLDRNGNLNNGDTGETSLAQKFQKTGTNLDDLFQNKDFESIKNGWIDIIKNKNLSVINDKSLNHIYYFFFLRGHKEYYLCGIEVNIDNLSNVTVNNDRSTRDSVFLDNYIENKYGYTKIYKAKKRLELRLKAKQWVDENLVITFPIPNSLKAINLRDVNIEAYKKSLFN